MKPAAALLIVLVVAAATHTLTICPYTHAAASPPSDAAIFVGLDAFALAPGPNGLLAASTKAGFIAIIDTGEKRITRLLHPVGFEAPPGGLAWTRYGILISFSDTGDVALMDPVTGEEKWGIAGVGHGASGRLTLLNESYAAVAEDKELWVIRISDGSIAARYRFTQSILDVSAAPGGELVAITGRSNLAVFSLPRNRTLYNDTETLRVSVGSVEWSPDGKWIAVSGIIAREDDFHAHIYLYRAGDDGYSPLWEIERVGESTSLAWAGGSRYILADYGTHVGVFDVYSGQELWSTDLDGDVHDIVYVNGTAYVGTSYDVYMLRGSGTTWSTEEFFGTIGSHIYAIRPRGDVFAAAVLRYMPTSYRPRDRGYVVLYSRNGTLIWETRGFPGTVMDIEWAGSTILAAYGVYKEGGVYEAHIAFLDSESGRVLGDHVYFSGEATGYAYTFLDISRGGGMLMVAIGGADSSDIYIYNVSSTRLISRRSYSRQAYGPLGSASWSNNGDRVVVVMNSRIAVIDPWSGGELAYSSETFVHPNARWSLGDDYIGVINNYNDPNTNQYIDILYTYRVSGNSLKLVKTGVLKNHRLSKLLYMNETRVALGVEDRFEIIDGVSLNILYSHVLPGVVIDAATGGDEIYVATGDYGTVTIMEKPVTTQPQQAGETTGSSTSQGGTPVQYIAVAAAVAAASIAAYVYIVRRK